MAKVVSTEPLPARASTLLSKWELKEANYYDAELANATVLMTWPSKLSALALSMMRKLEAIQFFSAGVDDVPFGLIPSKIRMFSNAGAYSDTVSEHAWALILASAKSIGRKDKPEAYGLSGKKLAVLGCGGIGSRIGAIGKAFDMKTIGLSRSYNSPECFDEKYYSLETDIEKVVRAADVLVLALPFNRFSLKLLTYERLRQTRPNVIIVNIARAELMDEKGMYRFLVERSEARFATDVFWRNNGRENFDSAFWKLQNFVGTQHRAGFGANLESKEVAMFAAAENVKRLVETGNTMNEIKREDYV